MGEAILVTFLYMFLGSLILMLLGAAGRTEPQDMEQAIWGQKNPHVVCHHCHNKNCVRMKVVSRRSGLSSAKAGAAAVTGGWSILLTGLRRKVKMTQMHCTVCEMTWDL